MQGTVCLAAVLLVVAPLAAGNIVVDANPPLLTSEAGGKASFTVVLQTAPLSDVVIPITSSAPSEAAPSPDSLVFTPSTWSLPQSVTVTGKDDSIADGDTPFTVNVGPATSSDPWYALKRGDSVAGTNTDDDMVGVVVAPRAVLTVGEDGSSSTFSVVLASEPSDTVTITISSSAPAEGVITRGARLEFTADSWDVPQEARVAGVDDSATDGNQAFEITFAVASGDGKYNSLAIAPLSVINVDNDSPALLVTAPSKVTTEGGGSVTVTAVLSMACTEDVSFRLASSNPLEGAVTPSIISFTSRSWNTPVTFVVTGQDDNVDDGDVVYSIFFTSQSADPSFAAVRPEPLYLTNRDNDEAGVRVTPTAGLETSEAGTSATFTVVLTTAPLTTVEFVLQWDRTEAKADKNRLYFEKRNWNIPQAVTMTGLPDEEDDGDVTYIVQIDPPSGDAAYRKVDPPDVAIVNRDVDTATLSVVPSASPLRTAEGSTTRGTVVVSVGSKPVGFPGSIKVPFQVSDSTEARVVPEELTFSASNWKLPQTVTVFPVDDQVQDGDQSTLLHILPVVSTDPQYHNRDPADIPIVTEDNDKAVITVKAPDLIITSEGGGLMAFVVRLGTEPMGKVTVPVTSSDTSEGNVTPPAVIFTKDNWIYPATVTVQGVDDLYADGVQPYKVTVGPAESSFPDYAGVPGKVVDAENRDNGDTAGITATPSATLLWENGTVVISLKMTTMPLQGPVTVAVSSRDTTEGRVDQAAVTFTESNWADPQNITLRGVDDNETDGDQTLEVEFAPAVSAGQDYNQLLVVPQSLRFTVRDINPAEVVVTGPTPILVAERDLPYPSPTGTPQSRTLQVSLSAMPTQDLTLTVSGPDSRVVVSPSRLVFAKSLWNTPLTVIVRGVDNSLPDPQFNFTVRIAVDGSPPRWTGVAVAIQGMLIDDEGYRFLRVSPRAVRGSSASGVRTVVVGDFKFRDALQQVLDMTGAVPQCEGAPCTDPKLAIDDDPSTSWESPGLAAWTVNLPWAQTPCGFTFITARDRLWADPVELSVEARRDASGPWETLFDTAGSPLSVPLGRKVGVPWIDLCPSLPTATRTVPPTPTPPTPIPTSPTSPSPTAGSTTSPSPPPAAPRYVTPTSTITLLPKTTPEPESSKNETLVAASVAGIIVVLVIVAIVLFFMRSHRGPEAKEQQLDSPESQSKPPSPSARPSVTTIHEIELEQIEDKANTWSSSVDYRSVYSGSPPAMDRRPSASFIPTQDRYSFTPSLLLGGAVAPRVRNPVSTHRAQPTPTEEALLGPIEYDETSLTFSGSYSLLGRGRGSYRSFATSRST